MKKILIVSFIFSLFIICVSSFVYATGNVDMNLTTSRSSVDSTVYGSNSNTNINNNMNTNDNVTDTSNVASTPEDMSPYTSSPDISVGSTAALSSSSLSLSNILNIILIVLGILLVLFAIAILIRMR